MKAKVLQINGLFIVFRAENGIEDLDDSTFNEIMNVKIGDVIELSPERERSLKEKDNEERCKECPNRTCCNDDAITRRDADAPYDDS